MGSQEAKASLWLEFDGIATMDVANLALQKKPSGLISMIAFEKLIKFPILLRSLDKNLIQLPLHNIYYGAMLRDSMRHASSARTDIITLCSLKNGEFVLPTLFE